MATLVSCQVRVIGSSGLTLEVGFAERLAYVRWLRNRGRLTPESDTELADAWGVGQKWLGKWKTRREAPEGRTDRADRGPRGSSRRGPSPTAWTRRGLPSTHCGRGTRRPRAVPRGSRSPTRPRQGTLPPFAEDLGRVQYRRGGSGSGSVPPRPSPLPRSPWTEAAAALGFDPFGHPPAVD